MNLTDAVQDPQRESAQLAGLENKKKKARQYASCGKKKAGIFSLVGVGAGAQEAGTQQAQEAIASAQVLFGAKSVLENLTKTWQPAACKKVIANYDSGKILD